MLISKTLKCDKLLPLSSTNICIYYVSHSGELSHVLDRSVLSTFIYFYTQSIDFDCDHHWCEENAVKAKVEKLTYFPETSLLYVFSLLSFPPCVATVQYAGVRISNPYHIDHICCDEITWQKKPYACISQCGATALLNKPMSIHCMHTLVCTCLVHTWRRQCAATLQHLSLPHRFIGRPDVCFHVCNCVYSCV